MKRLLAACSIAVLAGCASGMVPMSDKPAPEYWPLLRTSYWLNDPAKVVAACYDAVPTWAKFTGGVAPACAYIDFDKLTCGINVGYGQFTQLGHELSHCYGAGHVGDDLESKWEAHLHKMFDKEEDLKGFYYRRSSDGKFVMVTRDREKVLHFKVQ